MSRRKEVEKLAARYGATVSMTKREHLKIQHHSGWFVYASSTPNSPSLKKVEADLKRAMKRGKQTR